MPRILSSLTSCASDIFALDLHPSSIQGNCKCGQWLVLASRVDGAFLLGRAAVAFSSPPLVGATVNVASNYAVSNLPSLVPMTFDIAMKAVSVPLNTLTLAPLVDHTPQPPCFDTDWVTDILRGGAVLATAIVRVPCCNIRCCTVAFRVVSTAPPIPAPPSSTPPIPPMGGDELHAPWVVTPSGPSAAPKVGLVNASTVIIVSASTSGSRLAPSPRPLSSAGNSPPPPPRRTSRPWHRLLPPSLLIPSVLSSPTTTTAPAVSVGDAATQHCANSPPTLLAPIIGIVGAGSVGRCVVTSCDVCGLPMARVWSREGAVLNVADGGGGREGGAAAEAAAKVSTSSVRGGSVDGNCDAPLPLDRHCCFDGLCIEDMRSGGVLTLLAAAAVADCIVASPTQNGVNNGALAPIMSTLPASTSTPSRNLRIAFISAADVVRRVSAAIARARGPGRRGGGGEGGHGGGVSASATVQGFGSARACTAGAAMGGDGTGVEVGGDDEVVLQSSTSASPVVVLEQLLLSFTTQLSFPPYEGVSGVGLLSGGVGDSGDAEGESASARVGCGRVVVAGAASRLRWACEIGKESIFGESGGAMGDGVEVVCGGAVKPWPCVGGAPQGVTDEAAGDAAGVGDGVANASSLSPSRPYGGPFRLPSAVCAESEFGVDAISFPSVGCSEAGAWRVRRHLYGTQLAAPGIGGGQGREAGRRSTAPGVDVVVLDSLTELAKILGGGTDSAETEGGGPRAIGGGARNSHRGSGGRSGATAIDAKGASLLNALVAAFRRLPLGVCRPAIVAISDVAREAVPSLCTPSTFTYWVRSPLPTAAAAAATLHALCDMHLGGGVTLPGGVAMAVGTALCGVSLQQLRNVLRAANGVRRVRVKAGEGGKVAKKSSKSVKTTKVATVGAEAGPPAGGAGVAVAQSVVGEDVAAQQGGSDGRAVRAAGGGHVKSFMPSRKPSRQSETPSTTTTPPSSSTVGAAFELSDFTEGVAEVVDGAPSRKEGKNETKTMGVGSGVQVRRLFRKAPRKVIPSAKAAERQGREEGGVECLGRAGGGGRALRDSMGVRGAEPKEVDGTSAAPRGRGRGVVGEGREGREGREGGRLPRSTVARVGESADVEGRQPALGPVGVAGRSQQGHGATVGVIPTVKTPVRRSTVATSVANAAKHQPADRPPPAHPPSLLFAAETMGLYGVARVAEVLTKRVLWPLWRPDLFAARGVEAPRGVIFHGAPGTGKTAMVRAMVSVARNVRFIFASAADLYSPYLGGSEAAVRSLFARARAEAPCVVFVDEIEALAPRRGGFTSYKGSAPIQSAVQERGGGSHPSEGDIGSGIKDGDADRNAAREGGGCANGKRKTAASPSTSHPTRGGRQGEGGPIGAPCGGDDGGAAAGDPVGVRVLASFLNELDGVTSGQASVDRDGPLWSFYDRILGDADETEGAAGEEGGGGAVSRATRSMPVAVTAPPAVIVVGATNAPWALDPALTRPGRLDCVVHFGLPSSAARAQLIIGLVRDCLTSCGGGSAAVGAVGVPFTSVAGVTSSSSDAPQAGGTFFTPSQLQDLCRASKGMTPADISSTISTSLATLESLGRLSPAVPPFGVATGASRRDGGVADDEGVGGTQPCSPVGAPSYPPSFWESISTALCAALKAARRTANAAVVRRHEEYARSND